MSFSQRGCPAHSVALRRTIHPHCDARGDRLAARVLGSSPVPCEDKQLIRKEVAGFVLRISVYSEPEELETDLTVRVPSSNPRILAGERSAIPGSRHVWRIGSLAHFLRMGSWY